MYNPKYTKETRTFPVECTLNEHSWEARIFGQSYSGSMDRYQIWDRLKYDVGRMHVGISKGVWISEFPVERQHVNKEWSTVAQDRIRSPIHSILFNPDPDPKWRKSFRRRFIMHDINSSMRYDKIDDFSRWRFRSLSQPGLIGPSICVDMHHKKKLMHAYVCIELPDKKYKQFDIPKSYYNERGLWVDPTFEYLVREAVNTGNPDLIR